MAEMTGVLQAELRRLLEPRFELTNSHLFGDFLWDPDLTQREIFALDPSVTIEMADTHRRVVLMRIRGEIRFWICTAKDAADPGARSGLGVLSDVEHALRLCNEFLALKVPIHELTNPPGRIFEA